MVVFDKECETKAAKKSKPRIELNHNNNLLHMEFCLATSYTYFLRRYGFTFAYIDPMDADQVNCIFFDPQCNLRTEIFSSNFLVGT